MNNERILRVTSYFLLISGYNLHSYDYKKHRLGISILGIVNFIIITLFYAICFNQHFEKSPVLKVLQDVSPFLRNLTHLQLFLGLKTFIFGIYEMRTIVRATNKLMEVLPNIFARSFSRNEAVAYFLLFSTILVSFCYLLYIAFEMKFKLPPLDKIFVSMALFIPHFILAHSLRLFNVGSWLLREEMQSLASNFDITVAERPPICSEEDKDIEIGEIRYSNDNRTLELEKCVLKYYTQVQHLISHRRHFNESLQKQLIALIELNSNCLLAGVYSLIYFKHTWYVMFSDRWQRIFYAANSAIYVLILWDYLCLYITQTSFTKVKCGLYDNLNFILKERIRFNKVSRSSLKETRRLLRNEFNFKFFGTLNMTTWIFLMIQIFIASFIALIVFYQYFNDQIISLTVRLDEDAD